MTRAISLIDRLRGRALAGWQAFGGLVASYFIIYNVDDTLVAAIILWVLLAIGAHLRQPNGDALTSTPARAMLILGAVTAYAIWLGRL